MCEQLFLRGMPHLHQKMRRLGKNEKKEAMNPQDEPDFYSMPAVGDPSPTVNQIPGMTSNLRPAASPTAAAMSGMPHSTSSAQGMISSTASTATSPHQLTMINQQCSDQSNTSVAEGSHHLGHSLDPINLQHYSPPLPSQHLPGVYDYDALQPEYMRQNRSQQLVPSRLDYTTGRIGTDPRYYASANYPLQRIHGTMSRQQIQQDNPYYDALTMARMEHSIQSQELALEEAYRAQMRLQRINSLNTMANVDSPMLRGHPDDSPAWRSTSSAVFPSSEMDRRGSHIDPMSVRRSSTSSSHGSSLDVRSSLMLQQHYQQQQYQHQHYIPPITNVEYPHARYDQLGRENYSTQLQGQQLQEQNISPHLPGRSSPQMEASAHNMPTRPLPQQSPVASQEEQQASHEQQVSQEQQASQEQQEQACAQNDPEGASPTGEQS